MLPVPDHLYIHLVSPRYFFHIFPKYLCFDTACGSKKNISIKLFECVSSEYLLFHAMWTIFQLCHDEKKLLLLRDMVVSCFLLDQYLIHWNSNSHVGHTFLLGHIILIQSRPTFKLTPYWCVPNGDTTHTSFIVSWLYPVWPRRGLNPQSAAIDTSTLTIIPPRRSPDYLQWFN